MARGLEIYTANAVTNSNDHFTTRNSAKLRLDTTKLLTHTDLQKY